MDRAEFLRKQAERFLALAQDCADPKVRAKLIERRMNTCVAGVKEKAKPLGSPRG
jgi:hypothetical protein